MSGSSVRVVPELRAAHLARHREGTPAELLFLDTNYDFGDSSLEPGMRRVSLFGAVRRLASTRATTLEVPEPYWMRLWPKHLVLVSTFAIVGRMRRRQRRIVTYAMENNALETLVGGRRRAPRWLVAAVAVLIGAVARCTIDRICFASPAAEAAYARLPFTSGIERRTVLELPAAAPEPVEGVPGDYVFVGAMEPRKGVEQLMRAWEAVEQRSPGARLRLVGPGPLEPVAREWAARSPRSRSVLGQRSHDETGAIIARSSVLVAPSVPDGRWIEQVGLPIKEALARGLTVVTTDQTGLAPWLRERGHAVVPIGHDLVARLSTAMLDAGRDPIPRHVVRAALPAVEGRLRSDRWLHRP
ncbi:glycosyltransferase [Curtobacterium luteum]|uniref:glycosyltransferase n=1 Tax=Curtobacterium luteum TaxID=33881 RepID=UPI003802E7CF